MERRQVFLGRSLLRLTCGLYTRALWHTFAGSSTGYSLHELSLHPYINESIFNILLPARPVMTQKTLIIFALQFIIRLLVLIGEDTYLVKTEEGQRKPS